MSDKMRWRYGDTNPVVATVDSATVIEIGDLLWQDVDDAKPASMLLERCAEQSIQELFSEWFLGVAMQCSRNGYTTPVRVATTGVFEFECQPRIGVQLGDLFGAICNDADKLQNQALGPVEESKYAIGRVQAFPIIPDRPNPFINIRSTVMTGGIIER